MQKCKNAFTTKMVKYVITVFRELFYYRFVLCHHNRTIKETGTKLKIFDRTRFVIQNGSALSNFVILNNSLCSR